MVSMAVLNSYLPFRNTHAPCLLELCIPPSNGIVRRWLFPEFGAKLPLDNCTATIILNKHVDINVETDNKPNRLNVLFPQNCYNVGIKGIHILNAAPFCDDFISLIKRVFNPELAAKVSDFNRLHFPLHSALLFQYPFSPSIESATSFSSSSSSTTFSSCSLSSTPSSSQSLQSLLIFIFLLRIQLFRLLSCADWEFLITVSNNV